MSSNRSFDVTGASYFDGDVPLPRNVRTLALTDDGATLEIETDQGTVSWPAGSVRRVSDMAKQGAAILRSTTDPLARLCTPNPFVAAALPRANRAAPPKGRMRLAGWALAAVGAVAVQIGILIPLLADNLAEYVPPAGEQALGDATFEQIREVLSETGTNPIPLCENEKGRAALDQAVAKLTDDRGFRQDIKVYVLDHSMINAFALPGGYVVLFRGLIDAATGPDEVVAVLGHEIGHVISRDPTRHALRSAGSIGVLGLLFGDFAGGAAVLFLTERLISAQYSQEAESGADAFALELLAEAGINPGALGDLFETMRRKHGERDGVAAHFLSHPALGERIDAARAAEKDGANYTQSLDDAAWEALRNICE
ncbi:M48 family metallopeptidase [Sulfitobacter aestuariivivens]|uniref:M48 family metallopeptidase n=1 Tax=Sulfitobacter aestuariivivens TaxID=2766981 RepID=A0A927DB05_9RHOB|nr:M48 family metallopeptidase [Sulfitobacter aestuariivivens]MBD3665956.1 M48 family metallopeptidase [Sulfitobacter aestuariivivens]